MNFYAPWKIQFLFSRCHNHYILPVSLTKWYLVFGRNEAVVVFYIFRCLIFLISQPSVLKFARLFQYSWGITVATNNFSLLPSWPKAHWDLNKSCSLLDVQTRNPPYHYFPHVILFSYTCINKRTNGQKN